MKNTVDGKITKPKEKTKLQLTGPLIDRLQNYFGIALRSNLKIVSELRNALLASFSHVASSQNHDFHSYCPQTVDSWCQFQRDKMNNINLYKPGVGISPDVIKEVKPIYADLTKEVDLPKCLHELTRQREF